MLPTLRTVVDCNTRCTSLFSIRSFVACEEGWRGPVGLVGRTINSLLLIFVVVASTTLHKGGRAATGGLSSLLLPTTFAAFRLLAFRRIHRRPIAMYSPYSLLLLFLLFITQIATADALIHGRYPRFNHADNPNVSVLARTYPGVHNLIGT